jgi:hypothetical protein
MQVFLPWRSTNTSTRVLSATTRLEILYLNWWESQISSVYILVIYIIDILAFFLLQVRISLSSLGVLKLVNKLHGFLDDALKVLLNCLI